MDPRLILSAICFLFAAFPHASIPRAVGTLESVPDLEKAMYLNMESFPCVRLLNLSGEIGCSNPGSEKITAPIIRLKNSNEKLVRQSAILLPLDQVQDFFLRVAHDPELYQNVGGVLIESSDLQISSSGFSPADEFPQAAFAPYNDLSYKWNPVGSGITYNKYDFPVFLLSKESTSTLQQIARDSANNGDSYPANVAEFDLVMQTTNHQTRDSESCLEQQTCLPLGGYSVWSSLPPITILSENTKPIIMVVASQDSASFFRDLSLGADSPISGLIALLTAVDALSRIDGLDKLEKQLVFAVFTGEAWGYLGSRKFLHDLESGADSVIGLNSSMIEQVLEIGSVGKGLGEGVTNFYAHAGGESTVKKQILTALQSASESLGSDNVKVKNTSASNPGIPPSSLMTFLRKNELTAGAVLEDFDSSFSNRLYHSHLDNPTNINSSSIAAAAALVARALYILSTGSSALDLFKLSSIGVNVSLVEELVSCLLTCEPGLSCELVNKYITPSSDCPSHYVGVFLDAPPGVQNPIHADDTSRFVWNFLGDRTSSSSKSTGTCTGECSKDSEICIGAEVGSGGKCVLSTTRYVPAYSTRLKFENNIWRVIPANLSDPMGEADPVWTESYWNTIGLRVYTVESTVYDRIVLLGGVCVTLASYLAIYLVRSCLAKATKRD